MEAAVGCSTATVSCRLFSGVGRMLSRLRPRCASLSRTCRASCAERLGRNPKLHGRKSGSKDRFEHDLTAACTTRSRTEAMASGRVCPGCPGFGITHAVWCVGSCWALMLLPLLVSHGHIAVMAAVALWLAAERLDRPRTPRWRWRWHGPGKAARIVIAQARMRVQHHSNKP